MLYLYLFCVVFCVFYHVSLRLQVPIERKKKYVMIRKEVSGDNGGELSESVNYMFRRINAILEYL